MEQIWLEWNQTNFCRYDICHQHACHGGIYRIFSSACYARVSFLTDNEQFCQRQPTDSLVSISDSQRTVLWTTVNGQVCQRQPTDSLSATANEQCCQRQSTESSVSDNQRTVLSGTANGQFRQLHIQEKHRTETQNMYDTIDLRWSSTGLRNRGT